MQTCKGATYVNANLKGVPSLEKLSHQTYRHKINNASSIRFGRPDFVHYSDGFGLAQFQQGLMYLSI